MKALLLLPLIATPFAFTNAAEDESTCSSAKATATSTKDIVQTAVDAGQFKTLATALGAANLVGALQGEGPFTVFAPTDEAFAKLPKGTLETLLDEKNKGLLTSILTYHVVAGEMPAKKVLGSKYLTTLNGQRIDVMANDSGAFIDGAQIRSTDIECSNGIIHVIDEVILPASDDIVTTAVNAGSFKTLAAALQAAGLVEALKGEGPFTVFAPTDEAFAALGKETISSLLEPGNKQKLIDILKFHVVSGRVYGDQALEAKTFATLQGGKLNAKKNGEGLMIGDANVVTGDLETSNGVIHVIDKVLLP